MKNAVPAHKVPEPVYNAITENFEKLKKLKAAVRPRPQARRPPAPPPSPD